MKKKSSASLLAVALGLAVFASACGDDGGTEATTTTAKPAASTGATATTVAPATTVKKVEVTGTLAASGATFPKGFYELAIAEFKKAQPKATLTSAGGGSGKGRTDLQSQVVDWAGSDGLVKEADKANYKGGEFLYFPTVVAPITVSYNLDGVDKLQLSAETVAKIFQREIKTWDDAAIKKLNPSVNLPSQAIVVVHRSDGSGTTFIWTDYLSKVSAEWKTKVGASTAVEWPVGIGAKGNEGVANNVTNTKGSIGYVEYAYVKQNKMTYTKVVNKDGKAVAPEAAAFQAAAANADWARSDMYRVILTDQPGVASWPIAGATFILMYKAPQDAAAAGEALKFFSWAYANGGKLAEDLDYVPMPASVVTQIKKTWAEEIKDASGKPLTN